MNGNRTSPGPLSRILHPSCQARDEAGDLEYLDHYPDSGNYIGDFCFGQNSAELHEPPNREGLDLKGVGGRDFPQSILVVRDQLDEPRVRSVPLIPFRNWDNDL